MRFALTKRQNQGPRCGNGFTAKNESRRGDEKSRPLRQRDSSQIQFTSQDLPPSSEKDCSIRAAFGEMSIQT